MTSIRRCLLDRNACGDGLSIDDRGREVTTNRNALDFARAVHGDVIAQDGVFTLEAIFWSKRRGALANRISFGLAQPHATLANFTGYESLSYGYRPAEGQIWNNNASIATVQVGTERVVLGLYVYLSAGICTATWLMNGAALHTQSLPTGKLWVPSISMGSDEAGDLSCIINGGQDRFDAPVDTHQGWYRTSRGRSTYFLAHATEGFLSAAGDTPEHTSFGPYIIDAEKFSMRRAPQAWVHGGGQRTPEAAAYGVLSLRNDTGKFKGMLRDDARGSPVIVQTIPAPPGGAGTLADASTHVTALLDSVSAPDPSRVDVRLRDLLADLDVPLRCRRIPPFADESSRGRIYPIGIGAQRNLQPLLLDLPTLTYILGDAPMANVTLVADGGATLDPLASPPQWSRALDGAGIQLDTDPVMRLSVDCSSVGEQYEIPGAEDVLGGLGAFTTWAGGVPNGWVLPTNPPYLPAVVAGGSVVQTSAYGSPSALLINSVVPLSNSGTYFGYPVILDSQPLLPGRSYRITLRVLRVTGQPDEFLRASYGLMLLTKLSRDPRYWISPHLVPIVNANMAAHSYAFDYTVPAAEAGPLPLFLCVASRTGALTPPTSMSCFCVVDDIKVQLRGQYVALPLDGVTLTQAFREILINRHGLAEGCFSTADTEYLDEQTGILLGARWEEPPNVAAMLQELADTYCAVVFTDAAGVIRVKRFAEPVLADAVADIGEANVDPNSVWTDIDRAEGLTTEAACRRNCRPMSPGDFVSDTDGVPATQREQWQGVSQVSFTSSVEPCAAYAHARNAERFHMLSDVVPAAKREFDRVLACFATPPESGFDVDLDADAPRPSESGQRNKVGFRAYCVDGVLGLDLTTTMQQVMYGTVLRVTLPKIGLVNEAVAVLEWDVSPTGDWIEIVGHYR